MQLGHPGTTCHNPDSLLVLTVADSHAIHQISARFCACEVSLTTNKRCQVLSAGWYPATVTNPQTCVSIRLLEEFHLQNLKGGITIQAFVGALAKRTDPMNISPPPVMYFCLILLLRANILYIQDVEKSVRHIFRQFAFLKRLKRSGRGHDPAGVNATAPGETAVLCWACPHDGINLPEGWRDVDKKFAYVLGVSICARC